MQSGRAKLPRKVAVSMRRAHESLNYRTITVFVTLALTRPVFAQVPTRMPSHAAASAQSPTAQPVPEDQLGRSTPYGTVKGFLSAAQDQDFVRASKYLDSRESPERKEEIARELKLVMDRGLRVDLEKLSRKPEGSAAADLESNQCSNEFSERLSQANS